METGIYLVTFSVPGNAGDGIVVFDGTTVRGGDGGYTYKANFVPQNGSISGTVEVDRHNASWQSVFGPLTSFVLDVQGQDTDKSFNVSGTMREMPGPKITIQGKKVADL